MKTQWTKTYCGVSHLIGTPRQFQITLENRGSFIEASVIRLESPRAFSSLAEGQFETIAQAEAWGENQLALRLGTSQQLPRN